jgi:transcriptional regulator with XRE-family HTH domain
MAYGEGRVLVLGELLRFARKQQGITMQQVEMRGGPVRGYQSPVERGQKRNVSSAMLIKWLDILQISAAFARGEIGRYHSEPDACRGLGRDVGDMVRSAAETWDTMSPLQRQRRVLTLLATRSKHFNRVALAYALDLDLPGLKAMMAGERPIPPAQIRALAEITTVAEQFFMGGIPDDLVVAYQPAILRAWRKGLSPDVVDRLIEEA